MNILFLTLVEINSIQERGIYHDLLRKFFSEGHSVSIVTPSERRKKITTNLKSFNGVNILQVKTFNIQKTNIFEKGIGTLAIENQYLKAIKKHFSDIKFDLVIYSTPPITFYKIINYIKKRDKAYTYLLLKDIFPQNAVDMKMLKKGSFLHKMFLKKEKKLYQISDTIGCMSQANVDFILKNNQEIPPKKVEVNPNTIEPVFVNYSEDQKQAIKTKYSLPLNKEILVYGGNLGKPQGLDFLLQTIKEVVIPEIFYLIVGDGTEFKKINEWFSIHKPDNAKLIKSLPKNDYDSLLGACNFGLIFLHKDFTIPNFPSRLLSYLEIGIPVIAATDPNTDIGRVLHDNNCGVWVLSGNIIEMKKAIQKCILEKGIMGQNAKKILIQNFTVDVSYQLIKNKL